LLQNNLDPEVAEDSVNLVVYGGTGKAARDWASYDKILACLRDLGEDETLLVQSGKPVGILRSHQDAPRVLIANSNLVPKWATWDHFRQLEAAGLMMYGQMTAGSWIYIGSQGIVQGTYETFVACGRKHFGDRGGLPLQGKIVFSAGLGGMGGAQPLAAKLAGAVYIGCDADGGRIQKRLSTGYLDERVASVPEAIDQAKRWAAEGRAGSIAVEGQAIEVLRELRRLDFLPDVITDQTSAHDPLNGYYPEGLSLGDADRLRAENPPEYLRRSIETIANHVRLLLEFQRAGCVVFDYGNNLRGVAKDAGVEEAFEIPGFVPEYIRPMFCQGRGPFRWVALSGDPADIYATDQAMLRLFPEDVILNNWLTVGAPQIAFQGLPARICWLGYGDREKAGLEFNRLVREGILKAPVVIGRDHLDAGSVASPHRETEAMLDGSDAVADWPLLNAMINAVNGASWVSIHHGGGVGIGNSIHAGMVIVADGTAAAGTRLSRVLQSDPGMGVLRHVDAGYAEAISFADQRGIHVTR
jgi:urocanate hydratase